VKPIYLIAGVTVVGLVMVAEMLRYLLSIKYRRAWLITLAGLGVTILLTLIFLPSLVQLSLELATRTSPHIFGSARRFSRPALVGLFFPGLLWIATVLLIRRIAGTDWRKAFPVAIMPTIVASGIVITLVAPAFAFNREVNRIAACQENLKQIGQALQRYADSQGEFPPAKDWAAQLKPYLKGDGKLLRCPADTAGQGVSYEYHSPRGKYGKPPHVPVAWDRHPSHMGGRNCLFSDGQVKWLAEKDFKEAVKKSARLGGTSPAPTE